MNHQQTTSLRCPSHHVLLQRSWRHLAHSSLVGESLPSNSASANPLISPPLNNDGVGVLLLNLGGPETLDDVQPFLYNLFADPDIIRLPPPAQFLQPAIAQLVSTLRAPKSREGYEAIGGGSPLRKITQEQANALENALSRKGCAARTYVAMRYWKPFTGADGGNFISFFRSVVILLLLTSDMMEYACRGSYFSS